MTKQNFEELDRWVDESGAADYSGLSVAWFQRSRWDGSGPPFAKIGRAVRYKLSDLESFFESRKRSSTSKSMTGEGGAQ